MENKERINVALIGNPNSGKSSLFNILTGLRQHTSNFPGVTVEKKIGVGILPDGRKIDVIDMPGCYSCFPNSGDEKIVVDLLSNPANADYPHLAIYVLDIHQLERHLLLATQIYDLGIPMILVLNMIDMYESNGDLVETKALNELFPNIPVIKISSKTGHNIEDLKLAIINQLDSEHTKPKPIYALNTIESKVGNLLETITGSDNQYQNKLVAHHYNWLGYVNAAQRINIGAIVKQEGFENIKLQINETMSRFHKIQPIVKSALKQNKTKMNLTTTDKIDNIVTHSVWGPVIFFTIMFLVFQTIYAWSEKPMEWIETLFADMAGWSKYILGSGWIADLLADGIIAGLGGVMVFIPQITLLFMLIAILEESGYMSRAVYLFDGLLQRFGMNGRSIVALVSSGACAVPAIMSTRTIGSWKERIITIMVAPLISCSARLPVYALLVGFVVPDIKVAGILNAKGLVFMGLYLMGIIMVLVVSFILNKIIKPDTASHLMIELPQYKPPMIRNILLSVKEKVMAFVFNAGKVIMVISIILWFLASYGPAENMRLAEEKAQAKALTLTLDQDATDNFIASQKLEASYAGILGKTIEPVIRPLGFDWKIGIALITSFAAREVFVGTMATIYSVGSADDDSTIRQKMHAELRPGTNKPMYDAVTSMSLLIFYVFAMQCMSTLAVTKKETGSWKWTMVQLGYLSALAYLGSLIFYQVFS